MNCAASPGHYAESSEVLSRAQNRSQSQHSTIKPKPIVKLDKDSSQQKPSEEISSDTYDFEDISFPDLNAPKSNALNVDRKAKAYSQRSQNLQNAQSLQNGKQASQESQVFAASSSFVNAQANNFNGYYYKQPNEKKSSNQKEATTQSPQPQSTSPVPVTTPADVTFVKNNNFDGYQYTDPDRSSRRFQNAKLTPTTTTDRNSQATYSTTTLAPITYPNRGTTKYKDTKETSEFIINVADTTARTTPPPLIRGRVNGEPTTARYESPRTTPYYTPTVPSVSPARPVARNRFQESRPTVSSAKVAEHAMEMMQTIHDLKLDKSAESNENQKGKDHGSRDGLIIPPSSGPETIHSLALYFATAVDSLVTKPMPTEATTVLPIPGLKGLDVHAGNVTKLESSLVSDNTKRQYETLFGIDEDDKLVGRANIRDGTSDDSNVSNNDLETEFSNNPVIAASGTKQIRELAQVFTHALSAYLHDPSTFRRVLAEIRPTEPPPVQSTEYLTNRISRNKDFKDGTGATYLPTSATPSGIRDANGGLPTTEDLEVLDFSDVTLSTPFSKEQSTDINNSSESSTSVPAVDIFDTTRSQILHESLKQVDHVPASRILTEALETYALNQYAGNSLDGTTEPSNPLAIEINGGLEATTTYPYLEDFENQNNTFLFPSRLNDADYSAQTTDYPNIITTSGPLSFDLLPPSSSGNKGFDFPKSEFSALPDENDLQRAQSQSIYGNGKNNLEPHRTGKEYPSKNDIKSLKNENGHYITEITPTVTPAPEFSKTTYPDNGKINPNTWSTLSYSVFLDPLTINDGLMSSGEQSTQVPNSSSSSATYSSQTTQTPNFESTEPTISPYVNNESRQGKAVSPTNGPPTHEDYLNVMQRKANEMFGSLNDTSADHLMNVMKKADKNKTVRKLILLLIQTCDDDYNKTVEQSRQALLTALIGMDGKTDDGNEIQTIHASKPYREEKALNLNSPSNRNAIPTTTTQLPITTYHRPLSSRITDGNYATHITSTPQNAALTAETTTYSPLFQSTNYFTDTTTPPNYEYTTTAIYTTDIDTTTTTYYQPPTTTFATTTTTRAPTTIKSRRRNTPAPARNSKRLAKDLDQYLAHQGDTNYSVNQAHRNSDARALELLRSLYSLAGRFGK